VGITSSQALKEEQTMAKTSSKAPKIGYVGVRFESKQELLDACLAYFYRAYEFDGNDIIVECYDHRELLPMIEHSKSLSGAIWAIREKTGAKIQADYREDIMGA
jgi:hypothetical protein